MITDKQKRDFADLFYRHGDHSVHESLLYEDFSDDDKFLKLIYSAIEGMFEYHDGINNHSYNKNKRMERDLETANDLLVKTALALQLRLKTNPISWMEREIYSNLHDDILHYLNKVAER